MQLSYDSFNCTPGAVVPEKWKLSPTSQKLKQQPYIKVYRSFIRTVKTGKDSDVLQQVSGETVAPPYYGIQLRNKKEPTTETYNGLDVSAKNYAKYEKSQSQKVTYHDSIYTTFFLKTTKV